MLEGRFVWLSKMLVRPTNRGKHDSSFNGMHTKKKTRLFASHRILNSRPCGQSCVSQLYAIVNCARGMCHKFLFRAPVYLAEKYTRSLDIILRYNFGTFRT